MENKKKPILEETLLFMGAMTLLGGFINAYSFFERGQAFVSMHTGNMAKMGLSLYLRDKSMFLAALLPICGSVLGAAAYQIIRYRMREKPPLLLKKGSILVELVMLTAVSFAPKTISDNLVNWALSVATGFQLSTFRTYAGAAHNTTICTGNLRTLGQKIGDLICLRNRESAKKAGQYFCLLFSFPLGAFLGGFACQLLHAHALILGAFLLALQYIRLIRDARSRAEI